MLQSHSLHFKTSTFSKTRELKKFQNGVKEGVEIEKEAKKKKTHLEKSDFPLEHVNPGGFTALAIQIWVLRRGLRRGWRQRRDGRRTNGGGSSGH